MFLNARPSFLKLAMVLFIAGALFLWALFVSGCGPDRPKEDRNPAGSSSLTQADAAALASYYAALHNGAWSFVLPTGSMVPTFDSRSVVLLERYKGQPIADGDIVRLKTGVTHRVREVRGDAFYSSGDNARNPDGWSKLAEIEYRVAGILYTRR